MQRFFVLRPTQRLSTVFCYKQPTPVQVQIGPKDEITTLREENMRLRMMTEILSEQAKNAEGLLTASFCLFGLLALSVYVNRY